MTAKKPAQNNAVSVLKLIGMLAPLAVGAADELSKLWATLNREGRLTEGMSRMLNTLHTASAAKDPAAKLHTSLSGIADFVGNEPSVPPEKAREILRKVEECERRLKLSDSLNKSDRKKVLKAVKTEVSALVKETLNLGVPGASDGTGDSGEPEDDATQTDRITPPQRPRIQPHRRN